MDIIYLAAPCSAGSAEQRLARFNAVTVAAARLIERREVVFSPLTMTHPIDLVLAQDGETLGSDYWVAFDEAFMQFCSRIYVLKLPGWEASSGVRRELTYFSERGIQPEYYEPATFGITPDADEFSAAFTC